MRKFHFMLIVSIFLANLTIAQESDSLGLDDDPLLNRKESLFLHNQNETSFSSFDFTFKKIAFYEALLGFQQKEKFFAEAKLYHDKGQVIPQQLLILNDKERHETGGYDAILVYWSKRTVTPRKRRKILSELIKASI